jgi:hypothetical protein
MEETRLRWSRLAVRSLNRFLYAYVGNNPLNATDPTGEQSVGCDTCSASLRRDGLSEAGIRTVQDMHGRAAGEAAGEAIYRPGENNGRPAITITTGGGGSAASGNVGGSYSRGVATEVTFTPLPIITGYKELVETSSNVNPFDPTEVVAAVGADFDVGIEFAVGTIEDQLGGASMVEGDLGPFGISAGNSDSATGVFSPGNSISFELGPGAQLGGFHTQTEIANEDER